jgi:hypothetical protein
MTESLLIPITRFRFEKWYFKNNFAAAYFGSVYCALSKMRGTPTAGSSFRVAHPCHRAHCTLHRAFLLKDEPAIGSNNIAAATQLTQVTACLSAQPPSTSATFTWWTSRLLDTVRRVNRGGTHTVQSKALTLRAVFNQIPVYNLTSQERTRP